MAAPFCPSLPKLLATSHSLSPPYPSSKSHAHHSMPSPSDFDGGFLLGLAAEDLGDDALHLAAIAFVQEPRAPLGEGIAADDEGRQASDPAADELAGLDCRAVRAAEARPGKNTRQHDPHCAARGGTQGHTPAAEPVIRNRPGVAARPPQ